MRKFLQILAIVLLIGVMVSIFVPITIQAITPDPEPDHVRDPHYHVKQLTICCNELTRACGSD
jgi:hypothetical protein